LASAQTVIGSSRHSIPQHTIRFKDCRWYKSFHCVCPMLANAWFENRSIYCLRFVLLFSAFLLQARHKGNSSNNENNANTTSERVTERVLFPRTRESRTLKPI